MRPKLFLRKNSNIVDEYSEYTCTMKKSIKWCCADYNKLEYLGYIIVEKKRYSLQGIFMQGKIEAKEKLKDEKSYGYETAELNKCF